MNDSIAARIGELEKELKHLQTLHHDYRPHRLLPSETDTKLLAAHTPTHYAGDYPPYMNLTMVRIHGSVILTVRGPSFAGAPAGDVGCVRFTREQWRDFVALIETANTMWAATDSLDAMM